MSAPTFSVVVRTTGRPLLLDALESLATQTHRDFEVVLVDMSDGRMENKIEAMRGRLPQFLHLRPPGLLSRPAALNYAIERAHGRYIGVLDDDNYYEPPHLGILRTGVDQPGADLIYTGVIFRTFTPEGQLLSEERRSAPFDFQRLLAGNYIFCSASVYSKDAWRRVGGYDLRFPVYEDWEFLIRLTQDARVVTLPGFSSVSRSFMGQAGVPEHHRDLEECHLAWPACIGSTGGSSAALHASVSNIAKQLRFWSIGDAKIGRPGWRPLEHERPVRPKDRGALDDLRTSVA